MNRSLSWIAAVSLTAALTGPGAAAVAHPDGQDPAVTSAAGETTLPTSAGVSDHHDDGQSKAFDVRRVTGALVDDQVVLRMKVKDLTKANSKKVPADDGNSYWRTGASVMLAINSDKENYVIASRLPTSPHGEGYLSSRYGDATGDCNGDAENYGVDYVTNHSTNVVTIRFPVACLPGMETLHVSGSFHDHRNLAKPKVDVVAKRAGGTAALRWSPQFSVQ